jgi:hypothetical protein
MSEKPISNLIFMPDENIEYILTFTQIDENKWELYFGDNTINLSRIDDPLIKYESHSGNNLYIFVKSLNIGRLCNNMYGIAFSK